MKLIISLTIFLAGIVVGSQLTMWRMGSMHLEWKEDMKATYESRIEAMRIRLGNKEADRVVRAYRRGTDGRKTVDPK